MTGPSPFVLDQFGTASELQPLAGGQATVWRAGDLVFKPLDMALDALEWQEQVLGSVSPNGFRVAVPLRSRAGALAVDGWTAWPLLEGHQAPRWEEVIAVGERFHDGLANVERPAAMLDGRTDPWARADRVAWGEPPAGAVAALPEVARLLAARGPVSAPSQLVHGDLAGNVLFADGLPPAIIDLSPYWRPKGFAAAVVAVDAVVWYDADVELLSSIAARHDGFELLIRALLFRLLAHADPAAHLDSFRTAIDYLDRSI